MVLAVSRIRWHSLLSLNNVDDQALARPAAQWTLQLQWKIFSCSAAQLFTMPSLAALLALELPWPTSFTPCSAPPSRRRGGAVRRECSSGPAAMPVPWPSTMTSSSSRFIENINAPSQEEKGQKMNREVDEWFRDGLVLVELGIIDK
jgi:hypothetical protein